MKIKLVNHIKYREVIEQCKKNSFINIEGKKVKVNYLYGFIEDPDKLYLLYSDYTDKKTIFQSIFSYIQNLKIVKYLDSYDGNIFCSNLNKYEFSEVTKRLLSQIENQIK